MLRAARAAGSRRAAADRRCGRCSALLWPRQNDGRQLRCFISGSGGEHGDRHEAPAPLRQSGRAAFVAKLRGVGRWMLGGDYAPQHARSSPFSRRGAGGKAVHEEDLVGKQVGAMLGLATFLGLSFYTWNPPELTADSSAAERLWPALHEEVVTGPRAAEAQERAALRELTAARMAVPFIAAFFAFRSGRRYWTKRWADMEWQRTCDAVPIQPTAQMGFRVPIAVNFYCSVVGLLWLQGGDAWRYLGNVRSFGDLTAGIKRSVLRLLEVWFFATAATAWCVMPLTLGASRGAVWWATRTSRG